MTSDKPAKFINGMIEITDQNDAVLTAAEEEFNRVYVAYIGTLGRIPREDPPYPSMDDAEIALNVAREAMNRERQRYKADLIRKDQKVFGHVEPSNA